MHEQVIAKRIIAEAQKHGKVVSIEIDCGEVAHIPADELKDAMQLLTNWNVKVHETPALIDCDCGYTGRAKIIERGHDNAIWECPKCKEKMVRVLSGDQIIIISVEVKNR